MSPSISAIDTNFLLRIIYPDAEVINPATKKPIKYLNYRIEAVIEKFQSRKEVPIIPTPVIAEISSKYPEGLKNFKLLSEYNCFDFVEFDLEAALKLGELNREIAAHKVYQPTNKESQPTNTSRSRQDVKIDNQIVATALRYGATKMYTDDIGMDRYIRNVDELKVVHTWELPFPNDKRQMEMEELSNSTTNTGA